MSIDELKDMIIEKVNEIEDENLLKDILRLIGFESESDIYILNEEEIAMIQKAQADIDAGNLLSEEEAEAEIEAWFKKEGE